MIAPVWILHEILQEVTCVTGKNFEIKRIYTTC
jgi:hypothetical protein